MDRSIIGAFSEEQVERLTGLSRAQLGRWNRNGFIRPEYVNPRDGRSFKRIYSFKDLLKLRVLNQLRNVYNVPVHELRRVERELSHLGEDKWTSQKLWVHNRRVVFEEPESSKKREIASKQFIAEIPLDAVVSDAREDIKKLNARDRNQIGKIDRKKHIHARDPVFSGTRITVSAVLSYINAGANDAAILREFPDLESADIHAAREYAAHEAA